MAARAIIGIALGMLFLPIIYMFLDGIFWTWLTYYDNFEYFLKFFTGNSAYAMTIPLIDLFTTDTLPTWLSTYGFGIICWAIMGIWAGAIERSVKRGIGVVAGIWLGWLIIRIIILAIGNLLSLVPLALLMFWFALVIGIIFAAIFGAITKSEEF
ncbi:MAG: hypothetical protein LUQ65_04625 [Candidatus Helarchaeota archaeon]|nr:hypothetical protein [Candidatus Helarchaeota archaeon]